MRTEYEDFFCARRSDFPSLSQRVNGFPIAYFDGPGGSQVPQAVIDAITWYYRTCNANVHGGFLASKKTDEVLEEARTAVAGFLNASHGCSDLGIVIGPEVFFQEIHKTTFPLEQTQQMQCPALIILGAGFLFPDLGSRGFLLLFFRLSGFGCVCKIRNNSFHRNAQA